MAYEKHTEIILISTKAFHSLLLFCRYFTWDSTSFAQPADMIANVSAFGRKMVTIIDPHIRRDDGYVIYSEARANGYLVLKHDGSIYEGWCWPGVLCSLSERNMSFI